MASYPGGIDSLKTFMQKNIRHPTGQDAEYVGSVFVSFIVHENGTLSNFQVLKTLTPACDKNAIARLKKMPKWIPAMEHGKPIASKMVLPVRFGL
jgi:protein TonB